MTIFGATGLGVPISTTHAITGAILGVGTTKGVRSVRWIWGQRIVIAWVLTIPCAAFMAAITYFFVHLVIEPLFPK
jgi:PiT family inorganic phosphate transporter